MKQKIKRMVSMMLMFALVTGFLFPLMGAHEEPVEVSAASELSVVKPEYHKNCPYGSTQWEHTGVAVCWACSKDGCMNCGATGVYGRMYYGNIISDGIHTMPDVMKNYYNEEVEKIVANNGEHSGNYHRGYGYIPKKSPADGQGNYTITYYACWNCVYGGVSSDIYKDELILYIEYYNESDELTKKEQSPRYGQLFTSQIGHVLTFEEGPGITPTYWCPQCGDDLYKMYKAADPNYGYASPANRLKSIDDVLDYTPYAITNLITESSGSQFHLPAQYKLTLEVYPSGAGTVSLDGTTYRETVSDTYYAKADVSASQKAKDGYVFKGWYDLSIGERLISDKETLNTSMPSANTTWTAVYESAAKYQLKVTAGEGGTVNNVSGAYSAGTPLSVKATPKEHYKLEWTGYDFGSGIIEGLNSGDVNKTLLQFDMPEQDITLHANFISPTPTPTPVPGKANIAVNIKYSSHYTESGETSDDGTESSLDTEYLGTEVQYSFGAASIYDGYTYILENVEVPSSSGLSASTGEDGCVVSGEIAADTSITVSYKRTVSPPPHVCEFGDWIHNPEIHWKECKECKKQAEEGIHVWEKGEPDETGQVTKTCTICGRTESQHQHNWQGWYPTYYWGDQFDEEQYHWKVCAYENCGKTSYKGSHIPEDEYVDEGNGWLVLYCRVCDWIMDMKPITVHLTIHPNGGTFPNGSTEPVTWEIQYDQIVPYGRLGTEYFPSKDGVDFQGYYYVLEEGSGCVYAPDYDTMTCVAKPEYFQDNGDGTYRSRLKKDYVVYAQWRAGTYTVDYNANGAENIEIKGIMYPSYHLVGEEKALNPNGYYAASYITYDTEDVAATVATSLSNTMVEARFLGWAESSTGAVKYANKQVVKNLLSHAGTKTLYAVWDYGSIILPNATATGGGRKLSGWKKADGTFISVLDASGNYKEVEYAVCGDETFTAVWIPDTYTVSFDTQGGTPCDPIQVTYMQRYDYGNSGLPYTRKDGYTFGGWKHGITGVMIRHTSIVTTAADHTLVAQWNPMQMKITLDYNFAFNGTPANPQKNFDTSMNATMQTVDAYTDTIRVYYGDAYGRLPVPSMEGYEFAGWYLEEDAEGNGCGENACLISQVSRMEKTAGHTLHARWTKDQYRVDLDYNRDYTVWPEDE